MADDYDEMLPPIEYWEFHSNAIAPIIGLITAIFMLSHSCFHSKCKKQNTSNHQKSLVKAKYAKLTTYAWTAVISAMLFSFCIYFMEFWFLRLIPSLNPYTFCKAFTPFLFLSQSLIAFVILLYFTIRLETAFGGSVLAYPQKVLWSLRIFGLIATLTPTILSLVLTIGLPYSLKTQSVTAEEAWLCRNGVKWDLFWPFLFVLVGVGTMCLNFVNWYMFMSRLKDFVRLRLKDDDSFINFYSSTHNLQGLMINMRNKSEMSVSSAFSSHMPSDSNDQAVGGQSTPLSLQNTPSGPSPENKRSSYKRRMSGTLERRKSKKEEKKKRKARRRKQQLLIYELIKKQTILSGLVAITDVLTWIPSIFGGGSILILLNAIFGMICVYLSFNFTKKYFDFCCKRFMDNCTCIEDSIERKLAKEMGLDMTEGNEDEEGESKENEAALDEAQSAASGASTPALNGIKEEEVDMGLERKITEFQPMASQEEENETEDVVKRKITDLEV